MIITDNPVLDAERYSNELEEQPHITCEMCGNPIYKADSLHDGDVMYEFPDMTICEDCLEDYLKDYKKECK